MARISPQTNGSGVQPARIRRIEGAARLLLQLAVAVFGLVTLLVYLSFIPDYYDVLVNKCVLADCGLASPAPPTTLALLEAAGHTPGSYALLYVLIDSSFTLLFAGSAIVIAAKARQEPMALLASAMLLAFGATFPQLVHASADSDFWRMYFSLAAAIGWITLFLFFCMFPNGKLVPKWTFAPIALFAFIQLSGVFLPGTRTDHHEWPLPLQLLLFVAPIATILYSQIYRYRKLSTPEQKQQTKWVVYGLGVGLTAFIVISVLFEPSYYHTPMAFVYLNAALHLFLFIIPFTLTLAILRKRLWDVDPVVSRTIVYVLLSASIIGLYSFTIFYLNRLFGTEDRALTSLAATLAVALLFAPLKDKLQRFVDRLLKGRHNDPYGLLAELRGLLAEPSPPEAMLDKVVRFLRKELRIPYAAILVEVNGHDRVVAADGEGREEDAAGSLTFPIVHRGKEVGALIASPRAGETFSADDRRLIDVLLGHAGPVVDNFTMTRGMKLLAEDLQQSREKLVLAREEERRMLRRNLHDELAPRLASLGLNATAAEMYVKRDPEAASELLGELRKVIRSTVEDIRTLVRDMRPASLDEWGLAGAIGERIRELSKPLQVAGRGGRPAGGLRIELSTGELPPLPAAVEVAAYRIATEAIANAARHSQAANCTVKLEMISGKRLSIDVRDNGIGIDERRLSSVRKGIGIGSIRERAAELGGYCVIERMEEGGTRVYAELPVISEEGTQP
ncbi:GAF domain-containing sensor histidine kinase [Paenibacillus soyae]|uniref:histidine kinase n=1 Tax=Paenibacillus soyae TaxID=2969249 RepID=A0A9X2MTE9_9BACL|nr:GAF domain-containing sensor histidine kinase [Paenibacillus soyae]MCR2805952.1 sensor histidine kinase [Paenibacillus soyae]